MAHRGSPGIHAGRPTPQNLLSASRWGGRSKAAEAADRPTCWRQCVLLRIACDPISRGGHNLFFCVILVATSGLDDF
ncbi:hypothetical protein C7A07_19245 [Pseudomonas fragi]|nr:hypothetical protein C7A07_19245 [Pseudomonas fragi]